MGSEETVGPAEQKFMTKLETKANKRSIIDKLLKTLVCLDRKKIVKKSKI